MKQRYLNQARQLYYGLLERGLTCHQSDTILRRWASAFEGLHGEIRNTKRVQVVLNWFTTQGCGALFVPMVHDAESFSEKFRAIRAAKLRMADQTLRYFDNVLDYHFTPVYGSAASQERQLVTQRLAQQRRLVDDLMSKRLFLPEVKAKLKRPATKLSKADEDELANLVVVDKRWLNELIESDAYLNVIWEMVVCNDMVTKPARSSLINDIMTFNSTQSPIGVGNVGDVRCVEGCRETAGIRPCEVLQGAVGVVNRVSVSLTGQFQHV